MPDVNGAQQRFMEMSLHNPGAMSKPAPRSVATEFLAADRAAGKHFPAKKRGKGMVKP